MTFTCPPVRRSRAEGSAPRRHGEPCACSIRDQRRARPLPDSGSLPYRASLHFCEGSGCDTLVPARRVHRRVGGAEGRSPPVTERVVVVGGGFGGLNVVRALDGADVEVTVVDRTN